MNWHIFAFLWSGFDGFQSWCPQDDVCLLGNYLCYCFRCFFFVITVFDFLMPNVFESWWNLSALRNLLMFRLLCIMIVKLVTRGLFYVHGCDSGNLIVVFLPERCITLSPCWVFSWCLFFFFVFFPSYLLFILHLFM